MEKIKLTNWNCFITITVDREIFAFKYFRVLNFRRPQERRKIFNGEYFPIYGIMIIAIDFTTNTVVNNYNYNIFIR